MIRSFETLRFLAITVIFLDHYPIGGQPVIKLTTLSVQIFFMLSGFLFYHAHGSDTGPVGALTKRLMKARLARLYPLCLLTLPIAWKFVGYAVTPLSVAADLTLTQSWFPVRDIYFSGNSPLWFISSLLFCQAVSYPLLHLLHRRPTLFNALALGYVIIYFAVVTTVPDDMINAVIYINPLMQLPTYMLGMGVCALADSHTVSSGNRLVVTVSMAAVAVLVVFFMLSDSVSPRLTAVSYWWAPSALLLLAAALSERSRTPLTALFSNRVTVSLGRYAMAVYIIHVPAICIFKRAMSAFDIAPDRLWAVGVCYLLTFAAAIAAHHLVVGPAARMLLGFSAHKPTGKSR